MALEPMNPIEPYQGNKPIMGTGGTQTPGMGTGPNAVGDSMAMLKLMNELSKSSGSGGGGMGMLSGLKGGGGGGFGSNGWTGGSAAEGMLMG